MPCDDSMVQDVNKQAGGYQMNRLSLRNDRLKFKTAGESPIMLEESIEDHTPLW